MLQALPVSRLVALALLAMSLGLVAACDGDPDIVPIDSNTDCDPTTVLPSNFRPIPNVSTGMVNVTTTGGVTSGTIDATGGGISSAPDSPYIYVDLKAGTKVAIHDIDARMSMQWDIMLKRASIRTNGGDSGIGGRKLAVVPATDLATVTAAPTSGYATDDFADENCMPITLRAGDPQSAFNEWYNYNEMTHVVTPKTTEVYVLERPDGSHTAIRIRAYSTNGTTALYQVEWKQL
jgi:hypothetical protein